MEKNVALICVDLQNDFMPTGSLPVPNGDEVIPVINDILPLFRMVIFTKDWHPANCSAFASQHPGTKPYDWLNDDVLWPDHCVQGTPGADLHPSIDYGRIFGDFYIFKKGDDPATHPYSGFDAKEFDGTKLGDFLRERGIDQVYVCGLATDFCVMMTTIDAVNEGFETKLVLDACRGIDKTDKILEKLKDHGAVIVNSGDLFEE